MSASIVLAPYTSYNFTFRCNAATLTDALKYDSVVVLHKPFSGIKQVFGGENSTEYIVAVYREHPFDSSVS